MNRNPQLKDILRFLKFPLGTKRRVLSAVLSVAMVATWFSPLGQLYANPESKEPEVPPLPPEISRLVDTDALEAGQNSLDATLDAFEATTDPLTQGPEISPDDHVDVALLLGQRLDIHYYNRRGAHTKSRSIPLDGRPVIDIPGQFPADFARDVVYTSNEKGEFVIRHTDPKKRFVVEHTIPQLKVQSIALDGELIVVLNPKGIIYAINRELLTSAGFFMNSNAIVARVAHVSPEKMSPDLGIEWNHPSNKPVQLHASMDAKAFLSAGDLLITSPEDASGMKTMATTPLDRAAVKIQVHTLEATLGTLFPDPEMSHTSAQMLLAADPGIRATARDVMASLEAVRTGTDVFHSYSPESLRHLIGSNARRAEALTEKRYQFTFDDWKATHEAAKLEQERRTDALDKNTSEFAKKNSLGIKKLLSAKMIRNLVLLTGAWYFTGVGHDTGWVSYLQDNEVSLALLQWKLLLYSKLSFIGSVYDNVTLMDAALRSAIILNTFMPAYNFLGALTTKTVKSFKKMGASMTQCIAGMRIFGLTVHLFTHGLVQLISGPLVIKAMREGVNPFKYIRSDSYIAKVAAERSGHEPKGMTAGSSFSIFDRRNIDEKRTAIELVAQQQERTQRLAQIVAFKLAAEAEGVDPALLHSLSEISFDLQKLDNEQLKKLLEDKKFNERWFISAQRMSREFARMSDPAAFYELSEVSRADFVKAYEKAKAISSKIKKMSSFSHKSAMFVERFRYLMRTSMVQFGNWGYSSKEFLMKGIPSETAVSIFKTQMGSDMFMMAWTIALVGERTHMDSPKDLAGDPKSLIFTSKNHAGDFWVQFLAYGVQGAAGDAIDFRESPNGRERAYTPVHSLAGGNPQKEGYWKTLGSFTRDMLNFREREYGYLFWTYFKNRIETYSSFLFWGLITRYGISQLYMPVGDTLMAITWTFLMANWWYRWIWWGLNNGKAATNRRLVADKNKLQDIRAGLMEALRGGDRRVILDAARTLATEYFGKLEDSKFDGEARELIEYFKNSNEAEIINSAADHTTRGLLELNLAIGRLNEELRVNYQLIGKEEQERLLDLKIQAVEKAVVAARHELSQEAASAAKDAHMNATSLLLYSLRNAPRANVANNRATNHWMFLGAISTTIIGTALYVMSQHDNQAWGWKLFEGTLWSAGILVGANYAQRAYNYIYDRVKGRSNPPAGPDITPDGDDGRLNEAEDSIHIGGHKDEPMSAKSRLHLGCLQALIVK